MLGCFRFGGEEQHEENRVHLGNAIMSFYAALIDLLGRCAPEMHVRAQFVQQTIKQWTNFTPDYLDCGVFILNPKLHTIEQFQHRRIH